MLKENISSKSSYVFVAYSFVYSIWKAVRMLNIVITVMVKGVLRCSTQKFDTACEWGLVGGGYMKEDEMSFSCDSELNSGMY